MKSSEIIPAPQTDHDAIWSEIGELENEQKGPGYWKVNCSMLKDEEYVNYWNASSMDGRGTQRTSGRS